MSQVKITVKKNGSLRVDDPNAVIEMVDLDGNHYDLTGKTAFSLCRCGASANKPFCDGSHNRIAFQSDDKPPQPPNVP
ncbi:MAG: CDGSH iron-sulfur domain-containing protein [Terriglobales bacterium]|jgi:CDGSH-type Zn-finger protein